MKRIFAVILALALMCGAALAEEELNVTGKGTVYIEADQVSASLGVVLNGEDLTELQKQANNTVAAICEALQTAGLDEKDISTNYIYINPRYDYSGDVEQMVGYSITNSLTIRTSNIDSIGAYIDAAFAAGANSFDSISFSARDDSEARKQALQLAVEDAMSKAEVIASAAGCELGDITEISDTTQSDYYYDTGIGNAVTMDSAAGEGDAGTTVRAAQVSVSANVQITYDLKTK